MKLKNKYIIVEINKRKGLYIYDNNIQANSMLANKNQMEVYSDASF